jgi:tetratricopeptide (TPR) repeat protein
LTFDGILRAVAGDLDKAKTRYSQALEIRRRLGGEEGAGLSLCGLAQLAAGSGDLAEALDRYGQSLVAFEAVGDRAEEARILSEVAWTQLRYEDRVLARRYFLDSVQAYTDVASVRGVGLSPIGLVVIEAAEHRPARAVQIAAAAEVYAQQEGIVNVYTDETPVREFVDQARAPTQLSVACGHARGGIVKSCGSARPADHAATSSCFATVSTNTPFRNVAPARTRATSAAPLT